MPDTPSRFLWLRWLAISVLVLVLDQASKHAIIATFQLGESKILLSWFNLVLAYNTGAAFSFLADKPGWQREFFIVLTLAISAGLLWMLRGNHRNRLLSCALALVIGGAMGNLYDRVTYGYVIDFIQWHAAGYYWPAFNLADSAICLGAVLLIVDSFRKTRAEDSANPASNKEAT